MARPPCVHRQRVAATSLTRDLGNGKVFAFAADASRLGCVAVQLRSRRLRRRVASPAEASIAIIDRLSHCRA